MSMGGTITLAILQRRSSPGPRMPMPAEQFGLKLKGNLLDVEQFAAKLEDRPA
jgi:hypothetical protein